MRRRAESMVGSPSPPLRRRGVVQSKGTGLLTGAISKLTLAFWSISSRPRKWSVRPPGRLHLIRSTNGLRCALHSCGAVAEFHRASRTFLAVAMEDKHSNSSLRERRLNRSVPAWRRVPPELADPGSALTRELCQGVSRTLPVVFRPAKSMCACCASSSVYLCPIRTFSSPLAAQPKTSPARHSSSSRVCT